MFFKELRYNIQRIRACDPAARSTPEILLLYPGLHAVMRHRLANWFFRHRLFFLARWTSHRSRKITGIEIHPGAQIGRGLFIDHGSGVVIGETTVIGDDCVIYQGATLGGTGKETGKRHPTLGNNVMVGAGARVLGSITVGDNSRIAANAVVLSSVPPNSTAVGVPARVVKRDNVRTGDMDTVHVPDPTAQELCRLRHQLERMMERVRCEDLMGKDEEE